MKNNDELEPIRSMFLTNKQEIKSFFKAMNKSKRWYYVNKILILLNLKSKPRKVKFKETTLDDIRRYFK